MKLENLTPNTSIRGILPDCLVTVVATRWFGSEALELTFKDPAGRVDNRLLYRDDEPRLEVVEHGRPWSFDGDGSLFRLVSEAHRINLAHLFDPLLAIHTSLVDPLPHQITGVYGEMLPRQPLRFLLAEPAGLLERTRGARQADPGQFARDTERVAKLALDAVLAAERRLHFEPRDVSSDKYGYDVESKIPGTGKL